MYYLYNVHWILDEKNLYTYFKAQECAVYRDITVAAYIQYFE